MNKCGKCQITLSFKNSAKRLCSSPPPTNVRLHCLFSNRLKKALSRRSRFFKNHRRTHAFSQENAHVSLFRSHPSGYGKDSVSRPTCSGPDPTWPKLGAETWRSATAPTLDVDLGISHCTTDLPQTWGPSWLCAAVYLIHHAPCTKFGPTWDVWRQPGPMLDLYNGGCAKLPTWSNLGPIRQISQHSQDSQDSQVINISPRIPTFPKSPSYQLFNISGR